MLFNPKTESFDYLDDFSGPVMRKTIAFFENKGKNKLKQHHFDRVWYDDFLEVEPTHDNYERVKNVVQWQSDVAGYHLNGYPLTERDMLS